MEPPSAVSTVPVTKPFSIRKRYAAAIWSGSPIALVAFVLRGSRLVLRAAAWQLLTAIIGAGRGHACVADPDCGVGGLEGPVDKARQIDADRVQVHRILQPGR